MFEPLVKGAAVTLAAKAVGKYTSYGSALVHSPFKALWLINMSPTMVVSTLSAYILEVMTPDPYEKIKTWKQYLEDEARPDFIMAAADAGIILGLQWGKASNINWKNALLSIPIGNAAGCLAYDMVVKPAIVKKGRARSYKMETRTPGAMVDWGRNVASNARWLTSMIESNLEADIRQGNIIALDDSGWSS